MIEDNLNECSTEVLLKLHCALTSNFHNGQYNDYLEDIANVLYSRGVWVDDGLPF